MVVSYRIVSYRIGSDPLTCSLEKALLMASNQPFRATTPSRVELLAIVLMGANPVTPCKRTTIITSTKFKTPGFRMIVFVIFIVVVTEITAIVFDFDCSCRLV